MMGISGRRELGKVEVNSRGVVKVKRFNLREI
jgi:hypothetical protein